ncbi:MAG TPA: hypothetical protein VKA60_23380 [Blastocatellia bacterium]|nr:hypothetical protein [Blastocatellia bacterium]
MAIRVVKPTQLTEDEKEREPVNEAQMMRAVEAWVKEFRLSKDAAREAGMWRSPKR